MSSGQYGDAMPKLSFSMLSLLTLTAVFCLSCEREKKTIVCWGDSLTAPWNQRLQDVLKRAVQGTDYPDYLQSMLGGEYKVVNAGVSGENTLTIMARQGAFPMILSHDITIFKSSKAHFKTIIGNNDIPVFLSAYNHKAVTPFIQSDWHEESSSYINPCAINNRLYTISAEATYWPEAGEHKVEYNYYIEPLFHQEETDTIKSGSVVQTKAMRELRGKYGNIFFMGGNGGFGSVQDLINQYQAMIDYSQCSRYIIISFHMPLGIISTTQRLSEMEDSLAQAFGKNYINLRKYLLTHGLEDARLTATQEDKDSISQGSIPPQMLRDGKHFTGSINRVIAALVYRKIKELGW